MQSNGRTYSHCAHDNQIHIHTNLRRAKATISRFKQPSSSLCVLEHDNSCIKFFSPYIFDVNFEWIRKAHTLYSNKNEHEICNWQKGYCSLMAFYSILKYSFMISSNFFVLIIFEHRFFYFASSLCWSIFMHSKNISLKKCDMSFGNDKKYAIYVRLKENGKKVPFPHLCHSELKIKLTIHRWCDFFSTLLSI